MLDLRAGIFHAEFWITERGIVLGEFHARPGGDFIHALVECSRPSLELYKILTADLLGYGIGDLPPATWAAGVEDVILPPGRVRCVEGWEKVRSDAAVVACWLGVKPGAIVRVPSSSSDRHAAIVVAGYSRERVDLDLRRLVAALRIVVDSQDYLEDGA